MSEQRPVRRVGEILARLTRDLGLGDAATASTVFDAWEEAVGPEIAAHAAPVRLRDGTLTVEADSPGWAGELRFRTREIAACLNAVLGEGTVADVRVVVGS